MAMCPGESILCEHLREKFGGVKVVLYIQKNEQNSIFHVRQLEFFTKAQKIAAKLVCWHYPLITISATDPSKKTKGDFGEGHRTNDIGPVGECSFS